MAKGSSMNNKIYEFEAEIKKVPDIDGAKINKQPGDTIKVTIKERVK